MNHEATQIPVQEQGMSGQQIQVAHELRENVIDTAFARRDQKDAHSRMERDIANMKDVPTMMAAPAIIAINSLTEGVAAVKVKRAKSAAKKHYKANAVDYQTQALNEAKADGVEITGW
jgi:hypothetical protein